MANRTRILRDRLDRLLEEFPPQRRWQQDPVFFPRRFLLAGRPRAEVEAVALFAAMLSYGKVALFMGCIRRVLEACQDDFLGLIQGRCTIHWPAYRLSSAAELQIFGRAIGAEIQQRGGLFPAFADAWQGRFLGEGLANVRETLLQHARREGTPTRGLLHLLPDPASGGCAKRWNMFLRWLVRPNDGVDLGLWTRVSPSTLVIPLDRHISRIARHLGFTRRRTDDWTTAGEISAALRRLCPEDPMKYDFALCHLGISRQCTHGKDPAVCRDCSLGDLCLGNERLLLRPLRRT